MCRSGRITIIVSIYISHSYRCGTSVVLVQLQTTGVSIRLLMLLQLSVWNGGLLWSEHLRGVNYTRLFENCTNSFNHTSPCPSLFPFTSSASCVLSVLVKCTPNLIKLSAWYLCNGYRSLLTAQLTVQQLVLHCCRFTRYWYARVLYEVRRNRHLRWIRSAVFISVAFSGPDRALSRVCVYVIYTWPYTWCGCTKWSTWSSQRALQTEVHEKSPSSCCAI